MNNDAQPDLAPSPIGSSLPAASIPNNAELLGGGHKTTRTTGGEYLFNLTTYGGFALMGNEITSTVIMQRATSPTNNVLKRWYDKAITASKTHAPSSLPYLKEGRFAYISFATLGGMMMVPFIKALEDNKGKLVRYADNFLHRDSQTNPEIIRAHEEMDDAPKQSWSSLGQGRILTIGAAYTVDAAVGWRDAWSTKLLENTRFKNVSSFDRASHTAADAVMRMWNNKSPMGAEQFAARKGWVSTGFSLMTLSSALTVLFYASSKVFASRRDERQEREHDHRIAHQEPVAATPRHAIMDQLERSEAPGTTIAQIEPQSRVHAPELEAAR